MLDLSRRFLSRLAAPIGAGSAFLLAALAHRLLGGGFERVDVEAQIVARDARNPCFAVNCQRFDCEHVLRRHAFFCIVQPLPHVRLFNANSVGQRGLTADNLHCSGERFSALGFDGHGARI